jgi:hypothetical protein
VPGRPSRRTRARAAKRRKSETGENTYREHRGSRHRGHGDVDDRPRIETSEWFVDASRTQLENFDRRGHCCCQRRMFLRILARSAHSFSIPISKGIKRLGGRTEWCRVRSSNRHLGDARNPRARRALDGSYRLGTWRRVDRRTSILAGRQRACG